MENEEILTRIKQAVEPVLQAERVELIDFILRPQRKQWILRLLVDRPEGGITIGECALLNRKIGALLDQRDLLDQSYLLEVSSPGLDRPLKTKMDFERCRGKLLKVVAKLPLENSTDEQISVDLVGTLLEVGENGIVLEEGEKGKKHWEISYNSIIKANREIRF